jgi:hypothetical protein
MSSIETRRKPPDIRTNEEPNKKTKERLLRDLDFRNALADQSLSTPGYDPTLSTLARTIRNGIACSG